MHPRSLWIAGDVCWRCQLRLSTRYQKIAQTPRDKFASVKVLRLPRRALHQSATHLQLANTPVTASPTFDPALVPRLKELPIREHLEQWQRELGGPGEEVLSAFENHPAHGDIHNGLSKLTTNAKSDEETGLEEWDEDDQGEELITIGLFLKPGDVVELSQAGREPVLAVFVQQLANVSQFFSVNGRWSHSILSKVSFAIPGCIDPAMLRPLVPFLPTNPGVADPKGEVHVPADAALPVQRILEQMTEEAERIYRANAPVLDTAYAVLADTTRTRMMTLTQITKSLLAGNDVSSSPSPAALLAVRKALHHDEFRFKSDSRSHRLTNVFAIRPKHDVQVVETVLEWIREYREHLAVSTSNPQRSAYRRPKGATYVIEFIERARRLVAQSRKSRDPNFGFVGPSKSLHSPDLPSTSQIVWGESFSSTDKQIINFIHAWCLPIQFARMAAFHSASASIIMATGCYGSEAIYNADNLDETMRACKRSTGVLFLQEIGVISPYENRHLYDEQLMLPTIRLSRNLEVLSAKTEALQKNPDFIDSMVDLRRDWGATTVYCIDPVGAQEIDDGISIENIRGSESEFWLHVHVANPTAFFEKTHTLSGLAAHMTETVYLPERSFPMIPTWASQEYFSIARSRPVITFSTRVNRTGKVLETKIQSGTVQNIISITPSELSHLLGDDEPTVEIRRLVVGGDIPHAEPNAKRVHVSSGQLQELRDIFSITRALRKIRDARGALHLIGNTPDLRIFENANQAGLSWTPPSLDKARMIRGDPIIELTQRIPKGIVTTEFKATNIVEEMMLLACQTAASWCTDRHIPVMYRGTVEMPSNETLSSEELKQRLVLPYLKKHGDLPRGLATRYIKSLGRAVAHSAPLPHKMIGAYSYVKVTSPLRRFSDMIAHWQIEAALRYEAQSGKKFNGEHGSGRRGLLPFSPRQMQESIITLSPREKIIKSASNASNRFWTALAVMRAFHYKEAHLPDVFKCWVRHVADEKSKMGSFRTMGYIPEYGLTVTMLKGEDMQIGDEWEVRLRSVDMSLQAIFVSPIRLLYREIDTF